MKDVTAAGNASWNISSVTARTTVNSEPTKIQQSAVRIGIGWVFELL